MICTGENLIRKMVLVFLDSTYVVQRYSKDDYALYDVFVSKNMEDKEKGLKDMMKPAPY